MTKDKRKNRKRPYKDRRKKNPKLTRVNKDSECFHRTRAERERQRMVVFKMRCLGVPIIKIAETLKLSISTVNRDYNIAENEFKKQWQEDSSSIRLRLAARIEGVFNDALENYHVLRGQWNKKEVGYSIVCKALDHVLFVIKQMRELMGADSDLRLKHKLIAEDGDSSEKMKLLLKEMSADMEEPIKEADIL